MQYADDTLLFLKVDREYAMNLKWLLSCFEQLSGVRNIFHKCDMVPNNVEHQKAQAFSQILSCKLGVPL